MKYISGAFLVLRVEQSTYYIWLSKGYILSSFKLKYIVRYNDEVLHPAYGVGGPANVVFQPMHLSISLPEHNR